MDEARREHAAIADATTTPSFDNTIVAFEDSGRTFDNVETMFGIWSSTMNDAAFQAVEREMAPKLAGFADEVYQNE